MSAPTNSQASTNQQGVTVEVKGLHKTFGRQEVLTLRTRASFLIESYQLSLDCDHQWASAALVDVIAPRLLTADNSKFDPGCT